jgi:hypothetical protein
MKPRYGTLIAAPMSVPWAGSPRMQADEEAGDQRSIEREERQAEEPGLLAR